MNRVSWMARPSEREFVLFSFGVSALAFWIWTVGVHGGFAEFDFLAYRSAGAAVLHGHSPYPPATVHALALANHLVYPPLVAYAFVPFSLMPVGVGGAILFALLSTAMLGALAVLGVRDRRCYVVPFLAYPMATCLGNGAFGPFFALALALAWRYRDRARVVAPALALAIVAKLFLWPLCLWLLATRRWRAAAWTGVAAAVMFVVPFAPLGWGTLEAYPHLLHVLDRTWAPVAYSPHALFVQLGASSAEATTGVAALAVLLGIAIFGLAEHGREDAAFAIAICASLLLTPIAWPHYYVVLYVALGVCRPRLSPVWFSLLAFYILPGLNTGGNPWRVAIGLGIVASVFYACVLHTEREPRAMGVVEQWTS
jgi:alpha-1,2-mannosyltransferase